MLTVTAVITNECNFNCLNCIAGGPKSGGPEIDFDAMLLWLKRYAPGCDLHISGGEPLMVSGLYNKLNTCIDAGHDVTLFTNGSIIRVFSELETIPMKWHVTHHADQIHLNQFLHSIRHLKSKPHVICRLREGVEALNNAEGVEALYNGFNFKWMLPFNGYYGFQGGHSAAKVCHDIIMIGTNGDVFPCSTTRSVTLGNIYDMTFDVNAANAFECTCGKQSNYCQAQQSARIMRGL